MLIIHGQGCQSQNMSLRFHERMVLPLCDGWIDDSGFVMRNDSLDLRCAVAQISLCFLGFNVDVAEASHWGYCRDILPNVGDVEQDHVVTSHRFC